MKHAYQKAALILAIFSSGQLAMAQVSTGDERNATRLAREWSEKGKSRFDEGDYAGAIAALEMAEKHAHSPTSVHFTALAHERLGKLREARRLHQTIVDAELPPSSPQDWQRARRESAKAVQALDLRIPTLEIVITGARPQNLAVFLDGSRLDAAQLGRATPLDPGAHTVLVEAPGHGRVTREVSLKEQAREKIAVDAPPVKVTAPAAASRTSGAAAPTRVEARASTLQAAGPSSLTTAGYAAMGLGTAALVVGVAAGSVAVAKLAEARDECGSDFDANRCRADRSGTLETARTAAHAGTAGFVLAGLGAATGIVLLAWPGSTSRPRVGMTGGLLTIEGVF